MEMQLSENFKAFSLYICPVITMIAVVLTLVVTIHINRDLLMESLIGQPIYAHCQELGCRPEMGYRPELAYQYPPQGYGYDNHQ